MSAPALKAIPKHVQGRTVIAELPKKLAKRAVLAQNQHARRSKEYERDVAAAKRRKERGDTSRRHEMFAEQIRNARAWRHEDWIKGPLAPKRDVGVDRETFGAVSANQLYHSQKAEPKKYGIVEGDRVVVVKAGHRDRGKIGRVTQMNVEAEECIVEGVNMTNVVIPDYMLIRETDKTPVRAYTAGIHLADVRLVAPLVDPETGKLKDTIINELNLVKVTRREQKGLEPPTRFIAALEPPQHIPYPPKADETETAEEHDIDTLRIEVDEQTWIPTMHMPPMPTKVLDELRNKYGKFRIRHDDEYLAKIAKEDRKALKKERKVDMMLTPLKQRRRIERKEREAMGRPVLDESTLAAIGEIMEKNAEAAVAQGKDVLSTPSSS